MVVCKDLSPRIVEANQYDHLLKNDPSSFIFPSTQPHPPSYLPAYSYLSQYYLARLHTLIPPSLPSSLPYFPPSMSPSQLCSVLWTTISASPLTAQLSPSSCLFCIYTQPPRGLARRLGGGDGSARRLLTADVAAAAAASADDA